MSACFKAVVQQPPMSQAESFVKEAKDVHSERPEYSFEVAAGFTGLTAPLKWEETIAHLDVYIRLPRWRRGADLSRLVEAAYKCMKADKPPSEIVLRIAEEVLLRASYASEAEVRLKFTALKQARGYEPYEVMLSASLKRGGEVEMGIRVEVEGMSACPCTRELLRAYFKRQRGLATHTQRCTGRLGVRVRGRMLPSYRVLAEIVEESMSSPTRALLKREDEALLVASSLENAKLAEDIAREILSRVLALLSEYPEDTKVQVEVECLESVHKQDIVAFREATLSELRSELGV